MRSIQSHLFKSQKNILHAFTTKEGGVSQAPYTGNNLAYHVQDKLQNVQKNHFELAKFLDYPLSKLVHMNQVHGNTIINITKEYNPQNRPQCDALITDQVDIPLMVMVADCIPILLYDPVRKVIAAVHAGRAGIFNKILPKTIQKMQNDYLCDSKNILVSLGPSIHSCCYEVGEEIKKEAEVLAYGFAIKKNKNNYFLDLISIAKQQLLEINIMQENIEISPYCTSCNTQLFYSFRAEKQCGRFAGIIMLK